jgi:hypothetical protein
MSPTHSQIAAKPKPVALSVAPVTRARANPVQIPHRTMRASNAARRGPAIVLAARSLRGRLRTPVTMNEAITAIAAPVR